MEEHLKSFMQYVLVNGEGVKNYVLNCPHYVQNNLNDTKSVIVLHWKSFVDNETDLISLWRIFSVYLLKLVASKECAGFLSIVFILFICVLINSTYDIKHYNISNTGQHNGDEDQNETDDKFHSPKSVLKKVCFYNFFLNLFITLFKKGCQQSYHTNTIEKQRISEWNTLFICQHTDT
jgi:hypothetical protein